MTDPIKLRFTTIDRCRTTKTFKTLAGARKAAHDRLGAHPELGYGYAIAGDGIVKLTVEGATLADIFPADAPQAFAHDDYDDYYEDRRPRDRTKPVQKYTFDDEIPF